MAPQLQLTLSILTPSTYTCTVDDRQMGHVNQVSHLSKTPLNLLEIHEISAVDTSEYKQQNITHVTYISKVISVVPLQLTVPLTCQGLYHYVFLSLH